jgi:Glycosyltransferase family 87
VARKDRAHRTPAVGAVRVVRIDVPPARPWVGDALLYGLSAVFAGVTAVAAAIPLQRSWGRIAVWPYTAAAVVAAVAAFLDREETDRSRRRTMLAVVVFASAAVVALAVESVLRADGDPGDHAQSEVIVVEEAADALLDGRDPYVAEYRDGPLSDRPLATQVHFPYLPGMLAFGVPRALVGHAPWADARVWFAVVALAVALASLRGMDTTTGTRVRTFQVLFALPTGALLLATGGVDIPVLAVLLAAFVLVRRDQPGTAGLMAGLAMAMKQTSVLVLPFLLLAVPGGPARRRSLVGAALVSTVLTLPFALWNWNAFVEDTVLFPLNLGHGESAAETPTVGSLLLDLFPSQQTAVTLVLVAVIAGVVGLMLVWGRITTISQACTRAAGGFLTAVALAPAARAGYLVYPANLLVWALAFRQTDGSDITSEMGTPPPGQVPDP